MVTANALHKTSVERSVPIPSLEPRTVVSDILSDILSGCQGGNVPVDTHNGPYNAARKFTVNLSLTLANETSVEDVKDLPRDLLISEIIYIEDEMSKPHDPTKNFANCIPLLRPLQKIKSLLHLPGSGSSSSHMADIGHRRYAYHEALQTKLRDDITHNVDKPCIQGNVLKDPKNMGLSEGELLSALTRRSGLSLLLLAHRPDIQYKAYAAILEAGLLDAVDAAHSEVEYIEEFIKEVGIYIVVQRLALPKATCSHVR
ncbi:putative 3-hydroxyphenylacetate 6 hydroxylase [Seiridium cardinale]